MNETTSDQGAATLAPPVSRATTRCLRSVLAASMVFALFAAVGCGAAIKADGQGLGSAGTTTSTDGGSQVSSGFFSGDTSEVPAQLASRIGCDGASGNPQLDRYANSELSCLLDGDNEVTIFSFTSSANEQSWFALGPQSADDSGVVVLGDQWAVEPFDTDQANEIQGRVGGQVRQQP